MARNRSAHASMRTGAKPTTTTVQVIPTGGGTHAYVTVGSRTVHVPVARVAGIVGDVDTPTEADMIAVVAKAQGLAERFPSSDWGTVHAALTAVDAEAAAA